MLNRPNASSAPPSVRSETDSIHRPTDKRHRSQRKARSISSGSDITERSGSSAATPLVGIPSMPGMAQVFAQSSVWHEGQLKTINYGMPYTFHTVESAERESYRTLPTPERSSYSHCNSQPFSLSIRLKLTLFPFFCCRSREQWYHFAYGDP